MKRAFALVCALGSVYGLQAPVVAGQPAARIGDSTSPGIAIPPAVPISGTIVPPGAPTVLICGKPAARAGDTVITQTPSAIAVGSPTVLIGGQPAARIGDTTTTGAKIITGCPTVLIGG